MPAFVTHVLFGELVENRLPAASKLLIDAHPGAFFWGLQGPDLLFFRDAVRGKSPLPAVGGKMHTGHIPEQMEAFSRYIMKKKKEDESSYELLLSYFMGFLCHYVLDVAAHPYIYYLQERRKRYFPKEEWGGLHHRIESDIDTAIYRLYKDKSVRSFRIPRSFTDLEGEAAIARMLRHVIWDTFGEEYSTRDLFQCFSDTRTLMKATLEPTGALLAVTDVLERDVIHKPNALSAHIRRKRVEEDVLNMNKNLWTPLFDPDNPRGTSFPEIMEEGRNVALDVLDEWYQGIMNNVLPNWEGCPTFDNGSPAEAAKAGISIVL